MDDFSVREFDQIADFWYTVARAGVAEQADARDSKSCGLDPCGFDSHLRHPSVTTAASRVFLPRYVAFLCPFMSTEGTVRSVLRGSGGQWLIGVAIGLALGFAIGWGVWPVEYINTTPAVLRVDYRDEYVLMTAAAYTVEGDLALAAERMRRLNPTDPTAPVVDLAERLIAGGGNPQDIARLSRLAYDLGARTPLLMPYLGEAQDG